MNHRPTATAPVNHKPNHCPCEAQTELTLSNNPQLQGTHYGLGSRTRRDLLKRGRSGKPAGAEEDTKGGGGGTQCGRHRASLAEPKTAGECAREGECDLVVAGDCEGPTARNAVEAAALSHGAQEKSNGEKRRPKLRDFDRYQLKKAMSREEIKG